VRVVTVPLPKLGGAGAEQAGKAVGNVAAGNQGYIADRACPLYSRQIDIGIRNATSERGASKYQWPRFQETAWAGKCWTC
jgi:hypothetical protein